MVIKYLNSNKGSTLVLVLVTLSILSILGTAIIGLSVINYKMKIVDKNAKTSFYLAEAGLEEAYAVIGKEIENAMTAGNEKVKADLDNFIRKKRSDEAADPLVNDNYIINGSDGFGSVNERKLKEEIEKWFKTTYANYINGNGEFEGLENKLKNNTTYTVVDEPLDNKHATITVDSDNIETFDTSEAKINLDDNIYKITLESEINHNNITKKVRGTFNIKIPDYDSPYYVKNVMAKLEENVLWTKPITTEKNIYVLGNDVTINGDIYAYGKDENGIDGGIIVGNNGNKGELTVEGNIATNGFIYTNEDDSKIDVSGDIYCNSLAVPDGTEGCSITVSTGSVNTYDDIELNGTKANINIDGPYFGFSDGSTASVHDESSSIVINSDDIGNGSTLTITGKNAPNNNPLNGNVGGYITENIGSFSAGNSGVFIAGTVYVNLDDPSEKYQTGESVSIKGNYKAYGEYLDDVDERDDKFDPDNVVMGSFPPLVLISKYKEGSVYKEYFVIDKSNYINFYNNDKPSSLKLGGDNGIIITDLKYSAGAYISNKTLKNNEGTHEYWNNYSYGKEDDYQYFVNKMSDFLNYNNFYNSNLDDRVFIRDGGSNDGRFSFDTDIAPHINNQELICVNSTSTKAVFVKGEDGREPGELGVSSYELINLSDKDINGIIVTKGDVYITGKVNYRGIIAAEGNVYLVDDEKKVIENKYSSLEDKSYILNTMFNNENLKNQFVNGAENTFLVEVEAGQADIESYIKFDDIVNIEWQKIK